MPTLLYLNTISYKYLLKCSEALHEYYRKTIQCKTMFYFFIFFCTTSKNHLVFHEPIKFHEYC